MKLEYFDDTDTLLITISENKIVETRDIDENTIAEYDEEGNLVSVTLEHAKENSVLDESVRKLVA